MLKKEELVLFRGFIKKDTTRIMVGRRVDPEEKSICRRIGREKPERNAIVLLNQRVSTKKSKRGHSHRGISEGSGIATNNGFSPGESKYKLCNRLS